MDNKSWSNSDIQILASGGVRSATDLVRVWLAFAVLANYEEQKSRKRSGYDGARHGRTRCVFGSIFTAVHDLRNVTAPSTSSVSTTAMMTASTGVSLVRVVWRAEEPAAMRTRSPVPASTVSMATYGLPTAAPCSSASRTIKSLRPTSFSSLIVATVEPTTRAICMLPQIRLIVRLPG